MRPVSTAGPSAAELAGTLGVELRRVTGRLRGLAVDRLGQPVAGWPSRAAAVRVVAQRLADAAADLEGARPVDRAGDRPSGGPPAHVHRPLPVLADHALADQLTVTALDLQAALRGRTDPPPPAAVAAVQELAALRRVL